LPNPPLLYYGTEIGLSQRIGIRSEYGGFGHLGEARLPMEWGEEQDQDLYYFFQQLYQLRKELAFYKRRTISIEKVTSTELILTLENNPSIQLMINVGEEENQLELTNSTFTSFFSSSECGAKKIEHGMKLSLPACSGAILY
jgi:glycosidase